MFVYYPLPPAHRVYVCVCVGGGGGGGEEWKNEQDVLSQFI